MPRRGFLPRDVRALAGQDAALPIGDGATCSQPSTVAYMLALLDARPGHRVLDVGSGSGWTSALLSVLTRPGGVVHAVEIVPRLVEYGRSRLVAAGFAEVAVHDAGDVLGLPEHAPYDRILVSAAAARVPVELCEQLAVGGRLVGPVGHEMHLVTRMPAGFVDRVVPGEFVFVPLVDPEA